jgi:hypothetical protein
VVSLQQPSGKETYLCRGSVEDSSWGVLDFGNRAYIHHSLSGGDNTALLGHTNSCEDIISCKKSARLQSAALGHRDKESHATSVAVGHNDRNMPMLPQPPVGYHVHILQM